MRRPRSFVIPAVLLGLIIGVVANRFDLERRQRLVEDITSPVRTYLGQQDCANVPPALERFCRPSGRGPDPALVAAADALDREREAMWAAVLACKMEDASSVTRYLMDDRPFARNKFGETRDGPPILVSTGVLAMGEMAIDSGAGLRMTAVAPSLTAR